jgi:AraC-like DNA-binding protein
MQDFYKKALIALILLLVADASVAVVRAYQSYPSAELMPSEGGGTDWTVATATDVDHGGISTVRLLGSNQRSLRFDFRLTPATAYPFASGEMVMEDVKGNPTPADLSKYSTITFVAKCSPANTLSFAMPTFDQKISKPGDFLTYPIPGTYFSCNEKGTPVLLDLTRLTIPQWWLEMLKLDLAHLENVVAGTGANRNKINDILKVELGMTFTAYVKKLRLTESARLLAENPAATVSEVAYSVGYGSVSYFNKLFKEEYGCTPKVFKSVAPRRDALPDRDGVVPAGLAPPEHGEHTRQDLHDS